MLALLILLVLPPTGRQGASAQAAAPAAAPAFEVADLKLNKSHDNDTGATIADGYIHVRNLPLQELVQQAWDIRPEQITGAPVWMQSDNYDLAAKADHTASVAEIRVMLQNLLIERFHMTVHMSEAPHQAYVLTLEPGGESKLGPATFPTPEAMAQSGCEAARAGDLRDVTCTVTMDHLARALPMVAKGYFNHTTVDETGLTGIYRLEMKFAPNDGVTVGPSLFDALKQIGIHVEDKKVMLPQLVIDHIERTPAQN